MTISSFLVFKHLTASAYKNVNNFSLCFVSDETLSRLVLAPFLNHPAVGAYPSQSQITLYCNSLVRFPCVYFFTNFLQYGAQWRAHYKCSIKMNIFFFTNLLNEVLYFRTVMSIFLKNKLQKCLCHLFPQQCCLTSPTQTKLLKISRPYFSFTGLQVSFSSAWPGWTLGSWPQDPGWVLMCCT